MRKVTLALLTIGLITLSTLNREVKRQNLAEANTSYYLVPDLKLPYDPTLNNSIKWSSGPHQYGNRNNDSTMPLNSGSGIDFSNNGSTFQVISMASGTITSVLESGPFGKQISIQLDSVDHSILTYGHLASFEQGISVHQYINRGDPLGMAGNTTPNPPLPIHLHVELQDSSGNHIGWNGQTIDGWMIFEFRNNQEDAATAAYNYDGVAINVKDDPNILFGEYQINACVNATCTHHENVYTYLPANFYCESDPSVPCDNEKNQGNVAFSGNGLLGGGAYLTSSNTTSRTTISSVSIAPTGITRLVRAENLSPYPIMFGAADLEFFFQATGEKVRITAQNIDDGSTIVLFEGDMPLQNVLVHGYDLFELTWNASDPLSGAPVELCLETRSGDSWSDSTRMCTVISVPVPMGCVPIADGGQGCPSDFPDYGALSFYPSEARLAYAANDYCDHAAVFLTVGEEAMVTPGPPNNFRGSPGLSGSDIGDIPGSGVLLVVNGPICRDNFWWWQVEYNGQTGWTADGQGNTPWLQTVE